MTKKRLLRQKITKMMGEEVKTRNSGMTSKLKLWLKTLMGSEFGE